MSWLKPDFRYKYPHLLASDHAIWERFLHKYPDYFDLVDYDVHVGVGISLDPAWTPEIAKMATTLTQRRIDVVAIKDRKYYIIELKEDPGVSSLGQLLGYRALFCKDFPDVPIPGLILISNRIDNDLLEILTTYAIQYFIV